MPESPVFKGDLLNRFTMIIKFTKVQIHKLFETHRHASLQ